MLDSSESIFRWLFFLQEVPISLIRTERKVVSLNEGWGGKSIHHFPPYEFFKMYVGGEKDRAQSSMRAWLHNRFIGERLHSVPKSLGGMNGGRLFQTIEVIHKEQGVAKLEADLSNAKEELIRRGVAEEVQKRFNLLDSISREGYHKVHGCIYFRRCNGEYILVDGHHRVAALSACGHSTVTGVNTRNVPVRALINFIRYYRYYLNFMRFYRN